MKNYLTTAAFAGMTAVMLGAFGAHGLKKILDPDMLEIFKTGVQYQFYHSIALLATTLLMMKSKSVKLVWAARLFCVGMLIFSGSLYVLAITGIRFIGAITPLGGVAFVAGWLLLMLYSLRDLKNDW